MNFLIKKTLSREREKFKALNFLYFSETEKGFAWRMSEEFFSLSEEIRLKNLEDDLLKKDQICRFYWNFLRSH